MKKTLLLFVWSFSALFLTCSSLSAQPAKPTEINTGIATLYARDPLAQSLCFSDGGYGSIFQKNEVRNRCGDINFNGYNADGFTVGVEGARQGIVIDLGTPDDLQKKYGYSETVGKGQGFASLRLDNGKFYVLKDLRARTSQELREGDLLPQVLSPQTQTAPVKLGHVYLMRLTDSYDKDFSMVAKLLVIANVPNESVTFRWQIL